MLVFNSLSRWVTLLLISWPSFLLHDPSFIKKALFFFPLFLLNKPIHTRIMQHLCPGTFNLMLVCKTKKKKTALWKTLFKIEQILTSNSVQLATWTKSSKNDRFIQGKVKYWTRECLHQIKALESLVHHDQTWGKRSGCCKAVRCESMRLLQTLHLQKLMCYSSPSFTFKAPQSRSHCTLTGTFIQLFTSSVQWPKAFLLGIQSGRWWAVHNQSLLRLMTILDTPWKRETPGYWLVPSQVSQLSQISHFKQIIFF